MLADPSAAWEQLILGERIAAAGLRGVGGFTLEYSRGSCPEWAAEVQMQ